ncbi:MAG: hypothetical protein IJA94_00835 [Bacilli bacterium]|nr:hypothetical protein [Bacilli bacterium]
MTKKYKVPIIIITILLLVSVVLGLVYFMRDNEHEFVIKNKDIISKYNYSLKENDSSLKEEKFKELKNILKQDEIDDTEYAVVLAELFVVDVYDLDSKLNKYDIGGLEYIYESDKDKFKSIMQDTLYNNIEDNTLNNRKQVLPKVINVTTNEVIQDEYKINDLSFSCWKIKIKIDYKKDLGYDNYVLVTVIKDSEKLYVVEINPE